MQLRYHRIILGSNNRLLQKNKPSVDTIKENLIQCFETLDDNNILHPPQVPLPAEEVPVEVVMPQNPPAPNPEVQAPPNRGKGVKRKWYTTPALEVTEDKEKQKGEDGEEKEGKPEDELELNGNFSQGQRVAEYYDNKFYVGEVFQVVESGKAEVAFMEQVPGQNIFRWKAEDIDFVEDKVVFMWNVEMTSQNRRPWSVTN